MRARCTYANAMSTLAVFLVLTGGTALAMGLPRNSVDSRKVRDNALRSADLANGRGVRGIDVGDGALGGDVAEGSIRGADFADGSIEGRDLGPGSVGSADLAPASVGSAVVRPDAVDSAAVLNSSLRGADLGDAALGGASIDEGSLKQVPDAATLLGRGPGAFASSMVYERVGPFAQGTELPDGSFRQSLACNDPGDLLIAGGPTEAGLGATILESTENVQGAWQVTISSQTKFETWNIRVICAQRRQP